MDRAILLVLVIAPSLAQADASVPATTTPPPTPAWAEHCRARLEPLAHALASQGFGDAFDDLEVFVEPARATFSPPSDVVPYTRVSIRPRGGETFTHVVWWSIHVDDLDVNWGEQGWRPAMPRGPSWELRTHRGRTAEMELNVTIHPWPPRIWRFLRARIRPALDRCLVD